MINPPREDTTTHKCQPLWQYSMRAVAGVHHRGGVSCCTLLQAKLGPSKINNQKYNYAKRHPIGC
eukprot:6009757-Ditylum_brightwellii.AAC.1